VIPEGACAENVFAPFWAQRVVDSHEEFRQLKGLDDQKEKSFEEDLGPELEMGEETVEAGFVALEPGSVTQSADVPLTGLDQPRNCRRAKIRPTSFGKGQTKIEDYLRKFRCIPVVDHGPSLPVCEMSSQHSTSEDGLFFLNPLSSFNP